MASEADDAASTRGQSFESAAASTGIAGGQQGAAGQHDAASHHSLGNGSDTAGISRPTKPKMGGITICDSREVAYSGGIPLADWSGLDPNYAVVGYEDPNQLRSEKKPHEGFNTRTKGLDQKFGPKSDLRSVCLKVQEHFTSHGMDSIMYLPDPETNEMRSVIEYHQRFSVEKAREECEARSAKYDSYDVLNDTAGRKFLLDSLSSGLRQDVVDEMDSSKDPAAVVWMIIIEQFRSTDIQLYQSKKDQLKSIKPSQYRGEDLAQMCSEMRKITDELQNANQFDYSLILNILEACLEAGGQDNEEYRYPLRALYAKACELLKDVAFCDKQETEKKLRKAKLMPKDIYSKVKAGYKAQKDRNRWPPAKTPQDTRTPPRAFANQAEAAASTANTAGNVASQALALLLQQVKGLGGGTGGGSNDGKKKGPCHKCGEEGHWKRDCPQNKDGGATGTTTWRSKAPKPGESTTITRNGVIYYWCAKCRRWQSTHGTDSHVAGAGRGRNGRGNGRNGGSNRQAEANMLQEDESAWSDPSAWNVAFDNTCPNFLLVPAIAVIAHMVFVLFSSIDVGFDFVRGWNAGTAVLSSLWQLLLPLRSMVAAIPLPVLVYFLTIVGTALLLLLPSNWSPFVDPSHEPPPRPLHRRDRRAQEQARRRARSKRRWRCGSIRDHSLHRSYPLRLRSLGQYIRRQAPTIDERQARAQVEMLHDVTSERLSRAEQYRRRGQRRGHRRMDREGEGRVVRSIHGRPNNPPQGRPNRRRANTTYRPVPSSGQVDPRHGNAAVSGRRRRAMNRTLYEAQIMMASTADIDAGLAFLAPSRLRQAIDSSSSFPIIWDSGATICITNDPKDFVDGMQPPGAITRIKGLSKGLSIKGRGYVTWVVIDTAGKLRPLRIKAYYVPSVKAKLLSTSALLDEYPDEFITLSSGLLTLSGVEGDSTRNSVVAVVNRLNNLPTSTAYRHDIRREADAAIAPTLSAVSADNINLSEPAKELMRWHYRLAHLDLAKIQFLMRTGVLATSEATRRLHTAAAKLTVRPQCAACHFGKQRRRPTPGVRSSLIKDRAGVLTQGNLMPGAETSVDHFICSTKGRLFSSKGKSQEKDMYVGGCIFVDHASGHVHVEFQTSLHTHQTLDAKAKYEAMARDVGVIPQSYLADNGSSYTSSSFAERLQHFEQTIRFAGTGAHHHNGKAERAIQTIMSIARTMMLHAGIHWGEVADLALWPMAVQHAVYVYNRVPDPSTGLSPLDVFTNQRWEQKKLHDLHVWGCPVYVLDKAISDGKKLPRWKPRSHRCIYMGQSPMHASTVPLVLNPTTGAITAPYNCVFDDWFSTVQSSVESIPDFESPEWQRLFGDSMFQYTFDDDHAGDGGDVHDGTAPAVDPSRRRERVEQAMSREQPVVPLPVDAPAVSPRVDSSSHMRESPSREAPTSSVDNLQSVSTSTLTNSVPSASAEGVSAGVSERLSAPVVSQKVDDAGANPVGANLPAPPSTAAEIETHVDVPPPSIDAVDEPRPSSPVQTRAQREKASAAAPTRSSRRSTAGQRKSTRYGYEGDQSHGYFCDATDAFDTAPIDPAAEYISYATPTDPLALLTAAELEHLRGHNRAEPSSMSTQYAFQAASSTVGGVADPIGDPDTIDFVTAMSDPENSSQWREAARKEIAQLEAHGTWELDLLENAKGKILPGTWVFKLKRDPDGKPTKFKARYCVRGDLQDGEEETHSPVCAWSSVRIFLVMALKLGWKTISIDFSNAFVQAKLKKPIWIHLPRGFHAGKAGRYCLKLSKSLYGLRAAPLLWWLCLSSALLDLGFQKSQHDPCFMYKSNMMLVLYVDDAGIAAKDPADIDKLVSDLRAKGFELTQEGSFSEFLGIKITSSPDGKSVHMTQRGLIDKIVTTTGLEQSNSNWTPAAQAALGVDPDGEPMDSTEAGFRWSYRSVVGMLLYLSTNTRPDITFAVSQVCRFTHSPKKSHAVAVKMIVRYLRHTRDFGTIVAPSANMNLELYVDADFAGLYRRDPDRSSSSARSRTGYILFFGDIPLVWRSFLQSDIALSTLESEYTSLSHSIRTLIPIRSLVLELAGALEIPDSINTTVRSAVFEDNRAAVLLANNHRITSRTRYFHVKWHFFWEYVSRGDVTVEYISTDLQRADYLTKMNPRFVFERIRKMNQGW